MKVQIEEIILIISLMRMNYFQVVNKPLFIIINLALLLGGCRGAKYYHKKEMGFSKEWYLYSITINSSTKKIDSLGRFSMNFDFANNLFGFHHLYIKDNKEISMKAERTRSYIHSKASFSLDFKKVQDSHSYNFFIRIDNEKLYCLGSEIFRHPIFQRSECLIFSIC
ncbi:MAG: hypothetical protein NVV82_13610 [Sporocytophaga sp.]|nr:hypothetical protein [Sporocytophaga sp.]